MEMKHLERPGNLEGQKRIILHYQFAKICIWSS